jgi:hypothetical protein
VPAYEWQFSDVNPPVQAWAAWRIYQNEKRLNGTSDRNFLDEARQRLLLNFTWWVNREDPQGCNVFQGGFLGLARRMIGIFLRGADGRRPVFGNYELLQADPHWRDHVWFHEYFHGDTGAGLGASHQTGWTALVAALIEQGCARAAVD